MDAMGCASDVKSKMRGDRLQSQRVYHAQRLRGNSLPGPPTSPSKHLFEIIGPQRQRRRMKVEAARV